MTQTPTETEHPTTNNRLPRLWRVLLGWRDWNLPIKLAAVTLVPIIFAIVLGAMQIADQVGRADSYRRVDRLVAVDEQLRILLSSLQEERRVSALSLAGVGPAETEPGELASVRNEVDLARDELARTANRATFVNETTSARYAQVSARLEALPGMRDKLASGSLAPAGVLAGYTEIISALLSFDRATAAEVIDPQLASTVTAAHDLESAKEEIDYQRALVGVGAARGYLTGGELRALRSSQARLAERVADFREAASPAQQREYDRIVAGAEVAARTEQAEQAVNTAAGKRLSLDAEDWASNSAATVARIGEVSTLLTNQVEARSAALQDDASDGAGLASVIVLVALVIAGAVMIVVGRHLLRSLNALRRSALDVAERRLPDAVARILAGPDSARARLDVEPVPVHSRDEVGQVARAFDAVHRQAIRLAGEQTSLRAQYSNVFVNLSRRSQGLVQRQLQLLERLERDEEDADQLATLFQLDHLATRMRRNNENLMVLSGSDLGRRSQRPATLTDLLRAAVSEIEQYQRVIMRPPPGVLVVGYAVGDLVRLTAELLDNATAFSAPNTQVTVVSREQDDGSLRIDVLDEGIGMSEEELAVANAKLADSAAIDVSTSRRMGLFVVGRLAARHGIAVKLYAGPEIAGLRAVVTVPAELVSPADDHDKEPQTSTSPPSPTVNGMPGAIAAPVPNPLTNGRIPTLANGHWRPLPPQEDPTVPPPATTQANGHALPRRTRPTNGAPAASESEITRRLTGGGDTADDTVAGGAADDHAGENPAERTEITGLANDSGSGTGRADGRAAAQPAERAEAPPPLPRRSPGSGLRVPPAFPPGESGQPVSSADGLFTPTAEETTPIFDEMLSAWFRSMTASEAESAVAGDDRAPGMPGPWQFAADAGFQAAREVSERLSTPDGYTQAGLPRRSPRQNLVPGSASNGDGQDGPRVERSAEELRGRLSSYQKGVTRARGRHQSPQRPPSPRPRPQPAREDRDPEHNGTGPDPSGAGPPPELDLRGAGWRFSTSDPPAAGPATPGGLPRRVPREKPAGSAQETRPQSRAEELRGRLGSLQHGLSRGRRSVAERTADCTTAMTSGNTGTEQESG